MKDCIIPPEELDEQRKYAALVRQNNQKFQSENSRSRGVFVLTFGCQQNEADSEKIYGMAIDMGYSPVDAPEKADLIVVNTCAVREHAEQRTLSIVGNYKHLKNSNPGLLIGICGCMVTQDHRKTEIKAKFPQVDFLFGTSSLHRFPQILAEKLLNGKRVFCPEETEYLVAEGLPIHRLGTYRAWVSIMYGCNNYCSYCIVPYVRGRERSRRKEDVVSEVRGLVEKGYKDITLLGQNVNSYARGMDYDFADLLAEIDQIPGDYVIRFMSSHPKDASRKLIDTVANGTHIERHIHLPMQSGSDPVLKAMNRHYDMEKYYSIIDYIREKIPDAVITTDIIVGFPGETEEDFEKTIGALERVRFDMIYSFIYSPRKGTPASEMQQIPEDIKSRRFTRLLDVQNGIANGINQNDVGKVFRVLCDGQSKSSELYSGRNYGNKIVFFEGKPEMTGKFVNVLTERAEAFAFYGKVID